MHIAFHYKFLRISRLSSHNHRRPMKVAQRDQRKRSTVFFIIGYCLPGPLKSLIMIVMKQNHTSGA